METNPLILQSIRSYVTSDLSADVLVSYYLTSIYDHSALEAFSKVTQSRQQRTYDI